MILCQAGFPVSKDSVTKTQGTTTGLQTPDTCQASQEPWRCKCVRVSHAWQAGTPSPTRNLAWGAQPPPHGVTRNGLSLQVIEMGCVAYEKVVTELSPSCQQ